jgi:hypothetical protein
MISSVVRDETPVNMGRNRRIKRKDREMSKDRNKSRDIY